MFSFSKLLSNFRTSCRLSTRCRADDSFSSLPKTKRSPGLCIGTTSRLFESALMPRPVCADLAFRMSNDGLLEDSLRLHWSSIITQDETFAGTLYWHYLASFCICIDAATPILLIGCRVMGYLMILCDCIDHHPRRNVRQDSVLTPPRFFWLSKTSFRLHASGMSNKIALDIIKYQT